jgi:hypothetical protein
MLKDWFRTSCTISQNLGNFGQKDSNLDPLNTCTALDPTRSKGLWSETRDDMACKFDIGSIISHSIVEKARSILV